MLIQISNLNTMYPAGNLKQNDIESCAFSKSYSKHHTGNLVGVKNRWNNVYFKFLWNGCEKYFGFCLKFYIGNPTVLEIKILVRTVCIERPE